MGAGHVVSLVDPFSKLTLAGAAHCWSFRAGEPSHHLGFSGKLK